MKIKFKRPTLQKLNRLVACFGALFTMVMGPVAEGAQAQKLSVSQMQSALDQVGLNRQITWGQFYNKNKSLFPPRVQKEIEPLIVKFKNQLMPQFEVVPAKGSDGIVIPNLRVTQGNELINVQWFGEEDKYVKFQNTNLSEVDIVNFTDMFTRITAGDEKYRKEYEKTIATKPQANHQFSGYPSVTAATWKKMSQKNRAAYIINMRLMWNDARRVLIEADKMNHKKNRKTSSLDSVIKKWDDFFAMFSPNAEAGGRTAAKVPSSAMKKGAPTVKANAGSSAYVSGSNCLVAGYISRYSGGKCSSDNIFDSYKDENGGVDQLVYSVNSDCSTSGQIACNPYIYGAKSDGSAYCVSKTDPSFQVATHFNGPCDSQSRLGTEVGFLANENLKNGERYKEANLKLSKDELDKNFKQEQKANAKMVEDFLSGLIARSNNGKGIDFSKPLTDDSLKSILNIKTAFDKEIIKAKGSCEAAASNTKNEPNFWGACDQLHRRFLNVAQFLQDTPGCPDGSKTINPDSLKCMCPAPQPEALPGTSCSVSPVAVEPVCAGGVNDPKNQHCLAPPASGDQTKAVSKENCEEKYPGAIGMNKDCTCAGAGQTPTPVASASIEDGPQHYTCSSVIPGAGKTKPTDKECGFLCSLGKFAILALPFVGVALGVYALYRIMKPKKPSVASAADNCPGTGTNALCPQTCAAPLVPLSTGSCDCAACPPGQTITDVAACLCSTSTTTTTYTCADGITKVDDLSKCPAASYSCWDGTKVANPLNCPEKPTTTVAPVKANQ